MLLIMYRNVSCSVKAFLAKYR